MVTSSRLTAVHYANGVRRGARRSRSELNFKFYRQATNKIVGISDQAAEFLSDFF